MGNQMVGAIPFGKLRKTWVLRRCDFSTLLLCSADLDIHCSCLFSHNVEFCSFIFMYEIFTWVVCVNQW